MLLAGELVDDDPIYLPKLIHGMRPLGPSRPLFAVLGNHEMYGAPEEFIARIRNTRVHLLVNEGANVRGLWIAGLSDYAARTPALLPYMAAALRAKLKRAPARQHMVIRIAPAGAGAPHREVQVTALTVRFSGIGQPQRITAPAHAIAQYSRG